MSNLEFENYLALIGKLLQLTRQQQESIGTELRDHLESRVADLMDLGMNQSQAVKQALEEFGDAALMAKNLQFVSKLNRRRWMMRFATFSIVGCFLAAVLTMALWPENPRFGAPDRSLAKVQDPEDKALASAKAENLFEDSKDPFGNPGAKPAGPTSVSHRHPSTVFEINEQIERTLLEVADLEFDEFEWSGIRNYILETYKINVISHPLALDAGLVDEEAISFKLSGLPLEIGLKHLLKSKDCTFIVKDGALIVIPIENAEDPEFLSIRSFDCRELIKRLDLARSSKRMLDLKGVGGMGVGGMGGGGMGGGGGMFSVPQAGPDPVQASDNGIAATTGQPAPNQQPPAAREAASPKTLRPIETREELLTHLVTSLVGDEEKWGGGNSYNLKVVNGYLVVRSTREMLSEVEGFLDMLDKNLQRDAMEPVG